MGHGQPVAHLFASQAGRVPCGADPHERQPLFALRAKQSPLLPALAEQVATVQRAAYEVEAALIGDRRIPGLTESAEDVLTAPLSWQLALDGTGAVVGAVGTCDGDREIDIDRLVVDPAWHRRGVASALLATVLAQAADADLPVTVSTGRGNAPAIALYDRFGFRPIGDQEVIRGLWVRRLRWQQRRAVRVICQDDDGLVLLLRWRDPADGHLVLEPPGGGVEPGETDEEAAGRELAEETGLVATRLAGALPVLRNTWWNGRRHVGLERFYLMDVPGKRPRIDQRGLLVDEQATALGYRWLPVDELSTIVDALEPPGLAGVVADLRTSRPFSSAG